jgi:hypothetical protein
MADDPARPADAPPGPGPLRARLSGPQWLLVGAGFTLATISLLILATRRGDDEPDESARLEEAARALAREDPATFAEFRPLTEEELAAPGPGAARGVPLAGGPSGRFAEGRPPFSWALPADVTLRTVSLRRIDGTAVWEREARAGAVVPDPAADPPLPPGEYVWTLSGDGPAGPVRLDGAFEVVSEHEAHRVRGAWRRIDASVPEDLRGVLAAQHALRLGFLSDARRFAREAARTRPKSALAARTLAAVERRLGLRP